mgnify:CR=1 FL=1
MKISDKKDYLVLTDEKDDVANFATFLEYKIPSKYHEHNIVVDLLKYDSMELYELLLFLKVSNAHRAKKQSFVIVSEAVNPDDIPFEMVVVPTLQEAADIIEMEEIERDLGF